MNNIFTEDIIISKIIGVTAAESRTGMSYFYSRPHHALIYKVSGAMKCYFGDCELEFSQNDIVYIPKWLTYRSMASSEPAGEYIIINFDTIDEHPANEIYVAHFENHSNLYSLFSKCAEEWMFKDSAHLFSCRSYTYKILALIARALDGSSSEIRKKIQPGLEFMRHNISDCSLTVLQMAEVSGMSESNFRKMFKEVFLVSPSRYIMSVRIGRAKDLLTSDGASGEYLTVSEVSRLVGFVDTDSFSRIFKKEVGMPPSEWQKMKIL